jgi:quercetin dioxygenase-like cupin family protein
METNLENPSVDRRGTMVRRLVALAIAAHVSCLGPLSGQRAQSNPESLPHVDRFVGSATLKTAGGQTRQVRATIRRWSLPGKQRVPALPESGFVLLELRAGKVTVTIDGKEEKHTTGDIWTVAANTKMSLEVTGEAATLDTVSLAPR